MTTWWEAAGLLPAKLGGVDLVVETIDDKIGRRIVAPLLPGADRRPAAQDLGKTEAPWTVSAYVIGDYLPTYKRLRELFDGPGPYTFTHPYLGEFAVDLPDGLEISQSMEQGGIAFVRFTAIPASDVLPFSEPIASPRDQVRAKALAAAAKIEAGFPKRWPGVPFLDSLSLAAGWVRGMADRLADASERARSLGSPVADLTDAIQDLKASAQALASTPAALARTIAGLVDTIMSAIPTPEENNADARAARASVLDVLDALARWDPYPPEERVGLPSETVEEHAAAHAALLGGLALAQAQIVLRDLPLQSTTEAETIGATMVELTEAFLAAPLIDETTQEAMVDLRTGWGVYALGLVLPQVETITLPGERAAIVLAMELYGDPERGEEIAELNGLLESSFLPGGVPLQVLTA